jgi:hypothetical protein
VRTLAFATATAVLVSSPVWAQAWVEYGPPDDGFTISFPGVPTVRNGVFTTADGAKYPSHVHTLRQSPLIFSMTVVDISKGSIEGDTAIDQAARTFTKAGEVRLDVPSRTGNPGTDALREFGREINVVRRDGSESMLQIFVVDKRLYIAEGRSLPPHAADNAVDTIRFVESVAFPRSDGATSSGLITPSAVPPPGQPVSVTVKAGRLTERWQWAPAGNGKVEYCRQEGRGPETCAVADNPAQGDHMPASPTAPLVSAVQPGQAWFSVGGTAYFCKHTSYKKSSPMEVTCAEAAKGNLPKGTPIYLQAVADGAARFILIPGYRSFFCSNAFAAVPDGDPSQVALMCQVL